MSEPPRAVVCLPTYDERDNLEPMVRALAGVLDTSRDRVLVIDDASPDGTGELADRLAGELPWLEVLHRPRKEGLGPAYVAGFTRVLASRPGLVLQLDCDFSHDPADVPRLLEAVERGGADVAIGSRYVPGGRIENWGPLRRAISRAGSLYARVVLGVPVRDLTGGFKCFRADVLRAIDVETVTSRGYAFQIETTYRALRRGLAVTELPIRFADRKAGRSKLSRRDVLEAAWNVPRWRLASLLRPRADRARLGAAHRPGSGP